MSNPLRYAGSICMVMILFSACDEQKRIIEPFVPSGNRVVLMEEFTGKGCTNCPKGSREIDNLLVQFPNNLAVVSIHAGFFADPMFFPLGQYDLRTDEGEFLFDYLGPNSGYPAGVINRIPVNGDMQLALNQWASAITTQLQEEPAIELAIAHSYNVDTRQLSLTVSGIGKVNLSGDIRLSIMLTESGIVDAQDDLEAGGIVQDYVHKHVLRDMLTTAAGTPIPKDEPTSLKIGETFEGNYTYQLNEAWDENRMEIIAFVHIVNGNEFPVLQAVTEHLAD